MDKIHAIRIFATITEMASFTQAARQLGLPKGTVSRQLQLLEKHLGRQLLQRTTRRVQLTADGRLFYAHCHELLGMLQEMDDLFNKDAVSISGRVRVDVPAALASHLLIPSLSEFLQQYPGIQLEMNSSERRIDLLREGFDCALRTGEVNATEFTIQRLGELTLTNCASPDYLARFGQPVTLDDLSQHAMIHFGSITDSPPAGFTFFDGQQYRSVPTGGMVAVNNRETQLSACLAGLGIIQIPGRMVRSLLNHRRLTEVLPHFCAPPLPVSLLYPPRRYLTRQVRVFMAWVTETIKDGMA